MNKKNENIEINMSEEVAQGVYSNLAVITYSFCEFVLDFVQIMPNVPKAHVRSRVIMPPEHAKRLMLLLQQNIARYESMHGKILLEEEKMDNNRTPYLDSNAEA